MTSPTRRTFLKTAALAPAIGTLSARSWAQVSGANGDIRVAVIGLNGRGQNHLASLRALKGVRIAAICDVDTAVLEPEAPFGESSGYVALEAFNMPMQVTAITHKRSPVFCSIISQVTPSESSVIKKVAYEPVNGGEIPGHGGGAKAGQWREGAPICKGARSGPFAYRRRKLFGS